MSVTEDLEKKTSSDMMNKEFSLELNHDVSNVTEDYNKIQIPDGGYGWVVCGCFFFLNFCTWGANSGYAIYLAHYLEYESFAGASKEDYASIGGLAFGAGLMFAPLIGFFVLKTNARVVIGIGIVFQCAALLMAAFSVKLWQLFLTQGLLISFGLAFICIPATNILTPWFRNKRTLAQGIGASGSGLGGILFNLAMQRIIEVKSVKWALISQCIICSSLSTVSLLLIRTRDDEVHKASTQAPKFFEFSLLTYPVVWFAILYVSTTILGYVVFLYSLSAFTVSLGYSAKQGSIVSCMISLGGFFFRPVVGHMSDIYGPVTVGIIVHFLVGLFSVTMWIPCRNLATAIAFAFLTGALMGSIWPLLASINTRIVGLHRLTAMYSILWLFIGGFGIVSPIIGLKLRRINVSEGGNAYVDTAIFSGMGYFGAALFLWLIRGYLAARDKLAISAKTAHDDGELHLHVGFWDGIKGLMTWRNSSRKI